jgi:DNA repair exonuclease SbcCD nuclease subunit
MAVDGVIAARPDAVVIAGDLFHSVRPTNAAIVFAFKQFQRLREALPRAPIVLVAGNHDTPRSAETGSILRLFEELGVDVAADEARRLEYPALDLSVLAVPHQSLIAGERPSLRPDSRARHRVMVLHGEIEGKLPTERHIVEYGGALVSFRELGIEEWSYVALGDYHVQHEVATNAWYSGSLEYVGLNIWGQLAEEAEQGFRGKGWLLADLERDTIIITGAWTNMSIEHTSRTGADKGFFIVVPEDGCSTMNADWHNASINYALQNVSTVTTCAAVTEAIAGVPAGV